MVDYQALVFDEADRLFDLGFTEAINTITNYLPPSENRLTMLFSATQTRKVRVPPALLSLASLLNATTGQQPRAIELEKCRVHFRP